MEARPLIPAAITQCISDAFLRIIENVLVILELLAISWYQLLYIIV